MKVKSNAPVVNTGDNFWQTMDHILCIAGRYPQIALKEARELGDMWEDMKEEVAKLKKQVSNLQEAVDVLETRENYD